jgi:hypothetical protein
MAETHTLTDGGWSSKERSLLYILLIILPLLVVFLELPRRLRAQISCSDATRNRQRLSLRVAQGRAQFMERRVR